MKEWVVYLIRCGDGTLYCGVTNDLSKRFHAHSTGAGAKYTRGRGPPTVEASWPMEGKSEALKRERAIKKMARSQKEKLILSYRLGSISTT